MVGLKAWFINGDVNPRYATRDFSPGLPPGGQDKDPGYSLNETTIHTYYPVEK